MKVPKKVGASPKKDGASPKKIYPTILIWLIVRRIGLVLRLIFGNKVLPFQHDSSFRKQHDDLSKTLKEMVFSNVLINPHLTCQNEKFEK